METLKNLPIEYIGELHEVKLINFSVDKAEVEPLLPAGLKIRDFNGRALISMVNVKLRNMRPDFLPKFAYFNYQHIGFRLLVDDAEFNGGETRGIHFLRSFTDKQLMVFGGSLFTNYKLEKGLLQEGKGKFELIQEGNFLRYALRDKIPQEQNGTLKEMVGALDRAYSFIDDQLVRVQIMRERWPIEWVNCEGFETNFFQTARFEGAFQVKEVIHYHWLPATPVLP